MDWVRWTTLGFLVLTWIALIGTWLLLVKLHRRR